MALGDLTRGQTYRVIVRAKTAEGVGPLSARMEFIAGGEPPAPQDLWAHYYPMYVPAGNTTYTKHIVIFDWSKVFTEGAACPETARSDESPRLRRLEVMK